MTQFIPHALNVSEFKRKISAIFGAFSAVFFVMCCVLYYLALIFRPLFLLVMLCTVCSTIAGIAGTRDKTSGQIWCYMLACTAAYGYVLLGGVALFYVDLVEAELKVISEMEYANVELENKATEEKIQEMKSLMLVLGVSCELIGVLALWVVHSRYACLGDKRTSVALMHAFSINVLPLSVILIVGGQYIVDTQVMFSAAITGIFMFFGGLLSLVISITAFIGSAFEYRRLLNIFSWISFFIAVVFVTVCTSAFFVESYMLDHIVDNWETIRLLLSPTVQSKYDKGQFITVIASNFKAVSFSGLVTGMYVMWASYAANTLQIIVHAHKLQVAEDKRFNRHLTGLVDATEESLERLEANPKHMHFKLRRQWHGHFKHSRRQQRIFMRFGCTICVGILGLMLVLMCISIVFASKCSQVSDSGNSMEFDIVQAGPSDTSVLYNFSNKFNNGLISISQGIDPTGNVVYKEYALNEETNGIKVSEFQSNQSTFAVASIQGQKVLGVPISCQESLVEAILPRNIVGSTARTIVVDAYTSVKVNLQDESLRTLATERIDIKTTLGNVDVSNVFLKAKGIGLTTESGKIIFAESRLDASTSTSHATILIKSTYGEILVANMTTIDYSTFLKSSVGQIVVSNLKSTVTHGASTFAAQTTVGSIFASDVRVTKIEMQALEGLIQGSDLAVVSTQSTVAKLSARTKSGHINLRGISSAGYVYVESHTGDITLHMKSYSFKGLYYIHSAKGSVTIRKGAYSYDNIRQLEDSDTKGFTGEINCGGDSDNCNYVGDIYITSTSGNIVLVVGCDADPCE